MRTAINRNENLIAESPQTPITQQSNQVARQMLNLANSSDFSIQTIANQANRLQQSNQTPVDQALPSLPALEQGQEMDGITEALLMFAARRDHVRAVIAPALAQGRTVQIGRAHV